MRIEYFLVLLYNTLYLLGNSSAGMRECPVYGVPSINVSNRQKGRANLPCITSVPGECEQILKAMDVAWKNRRRHEPNLTFGEGNSAELFLQALKKEQFWQVSTQKTFNDMA